MSRFSIAVGLITIFTAVFATRLPAAELTLVLVAGEQSSISKISPAEVRRLYLGAPVVSGGRVLEPLRNETDSLLREVFMQQVLFMSTSAYERQILVRTHRTGAAPPPAYANARQLADALQTDPQAVTYMFRETALATSGIKIVTQLWQEKKE